MPACDIKTHNLGCGAGWSSLSYPIPKGSEHSHCTVSHTLGLQDGSKAQQEAGKGKQGQSGVHPESESISPLQPGRHKELLDQLHAAGCESQF